MPPVSTKQFQSVEPGLLRPGFRFANPIG